MSQKSILIEPIHIVCGHSAAGTLKQSFDINPILKGEIWVLQDDLSIGPIHNLDSIEGRKYRMRWFNQITNSNQFEDTKTKILQKIKTHSAIQPFYLWFGKDTNTVLAFAQLLYDFKDLDINWFSISYPEKLYDYPSGRDLFININILNPSQVSELTRYIGNLHDAERAELVSKWQNLTKTNSNLRITLENGEIVHKEVTNFDDYLLKLCSKTPQKSAVIIAGAVIALSNTYNHIGDQFLNWRLKELVKKEMLKHKGTLNEIRDYQVQLP